MGHDLRDALLRTRPDLQAQALEQARDYNFKRYYFQGIGRYEPAAAYERGIANLRTLAHLMPAEGYLFGARPSSIDAAIYGFTANIHFYGIDTPLRDFLVAQPNTVRHCRSIHIVLVDEI